jgi:hypothetical protein
MAVADPEDAPRQQLTPRPDGAGIEGREWMLRMDYEELPQTEIFFPGEPRD